MITNNIKEGKMMKKSIIIIGLVVLIIVSAGIFAAGPGGSTMTRTITPSYGPTGQIFIIRLTATKGTEDMAGIINEIKPSSFTFYDEDNWGGTLGPSIIYDINGDSLDIAFTESGASGYYEYKLQAGSSSGTLSGNVDWAGDGVDDLGSVDLIICIDNDQDSYNVTGGGCGLVDCDDDNAAIHPGATELCDGIDNNCNGLADDGSSEAWYNQQTSCGLGVCAAVGQLICTNGAQQDTCQAGTPAGDDSNCNGLDDNCNGNIDDNYVPDINCFLPGVCAAGNIASSCSNGEETQCATGQPAGDDSNCNGLDDNCNGNIDDNYVPPSTSCGLGVCAAVGQNICVAGQIQDTCIIGQPTGLDENCNGIDENCDGNIDENYAIDTSCFLPGVCAAGNIASSCSNGEETQCATGQPAGDDSNCDGLDNNCNNQVDENYVPTPTSCGLGVCAAVGQNICVELGIQNTCIPDTTNQKPEESVDSCDSLDNDCDGLVDESKNTDGDKDCNNKVCNSELLSYMIEWKEEHRTPDCDLIEGCVSNSKLLFAMHAWKNTHRTCGG